MKRSGTMMADLNASGANKKVRDTKGSTMGMKVSNL